jgi:hypothetical protein
LEWLVRCISEGNIRWPEDERRIKVALNTYHSLKSKPSLRTRYNVQPDINNYSLEDLEEIDRRIKGFQENGNRLIPGAELLYDDGEYVVIRIGGPRVRLEDAIQAACFYGQNTNWCTRNEDAALDYLKRGPLYVIFRNGRKISQYSPHSNYQIADEKNKSLRLLDLDPVLLKVLDEIGLHLSFSDIAVLIDRKEKIPRFILNRIAQEPWLILRYCRDREIRWPEAEPVLLTNVSASLRYAISVIEGRWPELESLLLDRYRQDPADTEPFTDRYERKIMDGNWPEYEQLKRQLGMRSYA